MQPRSVRVHHSHSHWSPVFFVLFFAGLASLGRMTRRGGPDSVSPLLLRASCTFFLRVSVFVFPPHLTPSSLSSARSSLRSSASSSSLPIWPLDGALLSAAKLKLPSEVGEMTEKVFEGRGWRRGRAACAASTAKTTTPRQNIWSHHIEPPRRSSKRARSVTSL